MRPFLAFPIGNTPMWLDESYSGFTLWGEFVPDPKDSMPHRYYLTFATFKKKWKGSLTIGQHSYFWTSADCGDADLLGTDACATLDDAITMIKIRIVDLFDAFSGGGT